jgi:hypothetical protein
MRNALVLAASSLDGCELGHTGWCGAGHSRMGGSEGYWDQQQEVCMTLTILDPRTGQQVTITTPDTPSVRR